MLETLFWSVIVFAGRIVDVSLGTIRVNMIVRRKKLIAALVGFFEVAIFISIIVRIISELNNLFGVISYAGGFAVGTVIGIIISEKLSKDLISTNIISKGKSQEIKSALIDEGYGVTCYMGKGKDGEVEIINVVCSQASLPKLNDLIRKNDSAAFVVSYMLDKIRGGFIRGLKKK